jgi:hypothetical protein
MKKRGRKPHARHHQWGSIQGAPAMQPWHQPFPCPRSAAWSMTSRDASINPRTIPKDGLRSTDLEDFSVRLMPLNRHSIEL